MSDDTNTKYQIMVILGLLGLTGVLVVVGTVASLLNQITSKYPIMPFWYVVRLQIRMMNILCFPKT